MSDYGLNGNGHDGSTSLADLTSETIDTTRFYTPEEWLEIRADAHQEYIQALDPAEREWMESVIQDTLRRNLGSQATSDLDRLEIAQYLLNLIMNEATTPLYNQEDGPLARPTYVTVPQRVYADLEGERNGVSRQPEAEARTVAKATKKAPLPIPLIVGAVLFACLAFFALLKLTSAPQLSEEDLTATSVAEATAQALASIITPTPTPLALENIDRPIGEGDDIRNRYPTILEIQPASAQSRVFPVQQKEVEIAEWDYDGDPDVASTIVGMVVRYPIGIPYSPANKTFLESLQRGDSITLRMSTGQAILFSISEVSRVQRQDVHIFNQQTPGLVIVLLSEPAPDRLVIYADYSTTQEVASGATVLSARGNQQALPQQMVEHGDSGVSTTVLSAYSSRGTATAALPPEWMYLLVDFRIGSRHDYNTGGMTLNLVDASGQSYAPTAIEPGIAGHTPFAPGIITAGSEITATIGFLVPSNVSAPALQVRVNSTTPVVDHQLPFTPTSTLSADYLDVLILDFKIEGTAAAPGDLVVQVRLFNPTDQRITLSSAQVFAVFSPSVLEQQFPIGAATPVSGAQLPLHLDPGEARDVEFRFVWNGDPYVGIQIGGYQYVAVLR